MHEFPTHGPITVSTRLGAGSATITAEERDTAVVTVEPGDGSDASQELARNARVELVGDTLVIHSERETGWHWRRGGLRVTARVPLDSRFEVNLASADAALGGRWHEGSMITASGHLTVDDVTGNLRLKTASGDIRVRSVGGDVHANSASGDIEIGSVGGDAQLHGASGDLCVHDTGGSAQARTASGDIRLLRARQGELRAQTASGDVDISVLPGTGVYLDVRTLSGSTRSDLDVGGAPVEGHASTSTLSVRVNTISGDVSVMRATQPERTGVSYT